MPHKIGDSHRMPFGDPSDPLGLTALAYKHLFWMRVKNYSPLTVDHRVDYLSRFIQWANDRAVYRATEVTKAILEAYQRWLHEGGGADGGKLAASTQVSHLAALKAFFKWLARANHLPANPAADLERPKVAKLLPRDVLSAAEVEKVLAQPAVGDPLGLRDRAIMETLYSTGIRRSELVGLTVYDLDRERKVLWVRHGKGGKDRVVPVGERALTWVAKYEADVRPTLAVSDRAAHALFVTHLGEPFTADRLSQMVGRYVVASGVRPSGACHVFRHSMATLLLEGGADIRFIQAILGHASLETTQIYTHVSIAQLQRVHKAAHPAERGPQLDAEPPQADPPTIR